MGNDAKEVRDQVKSERMRERAVLELRQHCTEENLWNCIVVFQDYPFFTVSGLPFTYTLKRGRNGEFTKELFVDRMANSKSLAWSSIRIAFERAKERDEVIDRPKALGGCPRSELRVQSAVAVRTDCGAQGERGEAEWQIEPSDE